MCSPDLGFCRLDCILGAFFGKVDFFSAFGDILDFHISDFTVKRLRKLNIGALVAKIGAHFCYRTTEICKKHDLLIFPVFCSKSRSLEGRFSYRTAARITKKTICDSRGCSIGKSGRNLILAQVFQWFS